MIITTADLKAIGLHAPNGVTTGIADALTKYAERFGVTTVKRMAMLLANGCGETGGYTQMVENMNYSAERMCKVWPSRFKTVAAAQPYAHDPRALANKVYGDRMGNQGIADAGYTYRGRGLLQMTGRDRYVEFKNVSGIDVVAKPEILEEPDSGVRAAFVYWQNRGIAPLADAGNVRAARFKINGGYVGLADVQSAYSRAIMVLSRKDLQKEKLMRDAMKLIRFAASGGMTPYEP